MTTQEIQDLMDEAQRHIEATGVQAMGPEVFDYIPHPDTLPWGWKVALTLDDGAQFKHRHGLFVIMSGQVEDGKRWLHLSMSRKDRVPDYDEMCEIKRLFLGDDRLALQLFVPKDRHISLHPYCLHLWSCLDGDPIPDFAHGGRTI